MKVKKCINFVLIQDNQNLNILAFSEQVEALISKEFKGSNIIIDLLKYEDLTFENLLLFLVMSNKHRAAKRSFAMVNNNIDIDLIPDELVVVPTIQEAEDIIEMEEIERDLGF